MSRKESLLKGAAALVAAGLLIKVSNLFVRIPLTRLIGSEGLGIYQIALPAFWALYHLAAGGVPVAVQNLVAEYTAKGRAQVAEQVLRIALIFTTVAGGAATLALLFGAPVLARLLGEPRAVWPLIALAPAVLLSAVDSIYRNYLQGRKLMTPSAVASVLEQATKVIATVIVAYMLMPYGRALAAGGAAFGITIGSVIAVLYMVYLYRTIRQEDGPLLGRLESNSLLVGRMIRLAWPVTAGSVMLPLLSLIDVGIIQRGFLRAGYATGGMATKMYGAYSGIAVQVVWFPFVLTNALANALVPVLTAAKARGDHDAVRQRVVLGLRATALVCLPVAIGVALLAQPIAALFGDPLAAGPLLYLAPVALFGPLTWLMTAQLQALGETAIPMRNFAIATVLKLTLDSVVAPVRGVDLKGVAVVSSVSFLVCSLLNGWALERELGESLPWGRILRGPLAASVAMGGALYGLAVTGLLPAVGAGAVGVACAVAPVLYLGVLVGTGALTWAEIKEFSGPVGSRLERWLHAIWPWS